MNHPALRRLRLLALLLATLLPAACSSTPEGWDAALRADPSADPVAGAWRGTWRSESNGHSGALLCTVRRLDGSAGNPGRCAFRYHASWGGIFKARFAIDCAVTKDGKVTGSKDLGSMFGGVFHHEGRIDGRKFHATYKASLDHGVMELERVTSDR